MAQAKSLKGTVGMERPRAGTERAHLGVEIKSSGPTTVSVAGGQEGRSRREGPKWWGGLEPGWGTGMWARTLFRKTADSRLAANSPELMEHSRTPWRTGTRSSRHHVSHGWDGSGGAHSPLSLRWKSVGASCTPSITHLLPTFDSQSGFP